MPFFLLPNSNRKGESESEGSPVKMMENRARRQINMEA
jgi:hypothetical protein